MTNEEAIITLTNILIDDYGCGLERRDYDSISHAVKVMEKAEEYRWHNLVKNPEDMPKDGTEVMLVEKIRGEFVQVHFSRKTHSVFRDCILNNTYIAWRYIEPFEGEGE